MTDDERQLLLANLRDTAIEFDDEIWRVRRRIEACSMTPEAQEFWFGETLRSKLATLRRLRASVVRARRIAQART